MENWKPIKNYEGLYEISDLGRIKSYHGNKITILNPTKMKKGYMRIRLIKNKKQIDILTHVLVATHFIDNPDNKSQVNHKNGIKHDNNVSNLEWNTQSENMKHAVVNGYFGNINGENNNYHKLTTEEVLQIRGLHGKIKDVEIAHLYGVTQQCVYLIVKRKKWKHI